VPRAVRFRAPDEVIAFDDLLRGRVAENVARETGDFVVRRADGIFAYQLAVVVDDLAMGITEVVRGADLLSSTPRQVLLARLLGGTPPRFAHVPLVLDARGERLAKRGGGVTVREQREAGVVPGRLVEALARLLGLRAAPSARAMVPRFDLGALAGRTTVRLPVGGVLAAP